MTGYLSVAAKRIQPWLLRTPELALMRGASLALQEVTSRESVIAWLDSARAGSSHLRDVVTAAREHAPTRDTQPPRAYAADIDGVVPLILPTLDVAEQTAASVLGWLGGQLPGLEWEAWWCEADSFVEATMIAERGDATGRLVWLPATQECGLIESCASCRREPATPPDLGDDTPGRPGSDCATRFRYSGIAHEELRGARRSVENVGARRWAHDFDELATRGGRGDEDSGPGAIGRKESRSHLATVVADGNAMGSLFSRIARPPRGWDSSLLAAEASQAVEDACWSAVEAAARAVGSPGCEVAVIEPHFIGGDDIFVSVPAGTAWHFVAVLTSEFARHIGTFRKGLPALVREVGEAEGGTQPEQGYLDDLRDAIGGLSLGVGVCFAHSSHPVHDTHEVAERAMKAAKRQGRGRAACIGWSDLTADSLAQPFVIESEALGKELRDKKQWPDVFALSPSARAQLAAILRDGDPDDALVARWAQRVGWSRGHSPTSLDELPAALSRARWFPAATPEE